MLTELIVEGLGVIERAEVSLGPGSTALTGETGAGKTLVVAALGLLLGGRAERTQVREGSGEARAEGRFLIPGGHPAAAALAKNDLVETPDAEELEVVITRAVSADGRSRARINGRLVTLGVLEEVTATLVEIAGQREHQQLASSAAQRTLLDSYAGPRAQDLAGAVSRTVRAANELGRRVDQLRASERERSQEKDVLDFEIAEIEGAAPTVGESESLSVEATRLEHAGALAEGLGASDDALQRERGAVEALAEAEEALRVVVDHDPELIPLADRLAAARYEVDDVAGELVRRVVEPDPDALEEVRARLDVLGRLRRKYGNDEAAVLEYLERARARAAELAAGEEDLGRFEAERDQLRAEAEAYASELSSLRREGATRLGPALEELLDDLALPGARIRVALHDAELNEGGLESVEIMVSANPGEPLRPLAKVASGGELSRIVLALHLLTSTGDVRTMVFDEVDAAVGGEAARAVGEALARLARSSGVQVVVVTHLPQVAAFATAHHRVRKKEAGGRVRASVEAIHGDERVQELSRMLAGLPGSERAREHAQELLELAARGPA